MAPNDSMYAKLFGQTPVWKASSRLLVAAPPLVLRTGNLGAARPFPRAPLAAPARLTTQPSPPNAPPPAQVAAAAGVGYYVYSTVKSKMENRPPCPATLPILGNFHLLTPDPETGTPPVHKHMFKLTRKHGDVMGFW